MFTISTSDLCVLYITNKSTLRWRRRRLEVRFVCFFSRMADDCAFVVQPWFSMIRIWIRNKIEDYWYDGNWEERCRRLFCVGCGHWIFNKCVISFEWNRCRSTWREFSLARIIQFRWLSFICQISDESLSSDLIAMSEMLKCSLHDVEELPKDVRKLLDTQLYTLDLTLIPKMIR